MPNQCDTCGKEINRWPAQIRRYKFKKCYCSRKCLYNKNTKTILERFMSYVRKTETCWIWTRATNAHGYGTFCLNGKHVLAHRALWELVHGAIEPGKQICHSCDNPTCVREDHLWIGTHDENMKDRDKKGRVAKGEQSGAAKLTEESVRQIRFLGSYGMTNTALAKMFGVRQPTICNILKRNLWKHI